MNIHSILNEFNLLNSTLHKRKICEKYKNNKLFIKVFQMAMDSVKYTFGVTMKNVPEYIPEGYKDLEYVLDVIEDELCTRKTTGNKAIQLVHDLLSMLSEEDSKIVELILNRDLRINFGKREFNKIVSKENQCTSVPYMRCNTYSSKTAKKILYPAYINLKADGMFQYITVDQGSVTFTARSGEERYFQHLENAFKNFPDGVYVSELLVDNVLDRSEANGFINSLAEDKSSVYVQLWDYITLEEFSRPKDKLNKTFYRNRFITLEEILKNNKSDRIKLIPYKVVNNIQEALQQTSEWMNEGFEGSILKDFENIFIDHTSPTQLKLKVCFDLDVVITGFTEGTKGTKREKTFGAITYRSSDGKVVGSVSGFTDKQLEDFNSRRDELIGTIMTIEGNDLTKALNSKTFSISHPRFIELRRDKVVGDDLVRIQETLKMSKTLS